MNEWIKGQTLSHAYILFILTSPRCDLGNSGVVAQCSCRTRCHQSSDTLSPLSHLFSAKEFNLECLNLQKQVHVQGSPETNNKILKWLCDCLHEASIRTKQANGSTSGRSTQLHKRNVITPRCRANLLFRATTQNLAENQVLRFFLHFGFGVLKTAAVLPDKNPHAIRWVTRTTDVRHTHGEGNQH